jgi:hypothetical protein
LSEIQETLAGLKARIAEVEEQLAALEAVEEPVELPVEEDIPAIEEDMAPIDISIDVEEVAFPEAGMAAAAAEEPEAPQEAAVAAEPVAPAPAQSVVEPEPDVDFFQEPKASINDKQERKARKAVMDVMGQKLAWKTAMPGTPVKNVISAISLNDRVLFINTLFKEDPMAFQEAIAAFNAMSSFDEAEEYVRTNYPDWNLNSDLVFRLMMAVRRKLK